MRRRGILCSLALLLIMFHRRALSLSHRVGKAPSCPTSTTTSSSDTTLPVKQMTKEQYDRSSKAISRTTFLQTCCAAALVLASSPSDTAAVSFGPSSGGLFVKDRRQLELCLVAIWRVVYWADRLATTNLSTTASSVPLDTRKQAYLEARLAAKAMLTGKIGGGANYQVYTLSTLQVPACLQDLSEAYDTSRGFGELCRDFYESLSSLVEFDGMDTLTDPSPRSSLTLTQYNDQKEIYVRRILVERIVPLGRKIIDSFSAENVAISQRYIQQNYPSEIFPPVAKTSE